MSKHKIPVVGEQCTIIETWKAPSEPSTLTDNSLSTRDGRRTYEQRVDGIVHEVVRDRAAFDGDVWDGVVEVVVVDEALGAWRTFSRLRKPTSTTLALFDESVFWLEQQDALRLWGLSALLKTEANHNEVFGSRPLRARCDFESPLFRVRPSEVRAGEIAHGTPATLELLGEATLAISEVLSSQNGRIPSSTHLVTFPSRKKVQQAWPTTVVDFDYDPIADELTRVVLQGEGLVVDGRAPPTYEFTFEREMIRCGACAPLPSDNIYATMGSASQKNASWPPCKQCKGTGEVPGEKRWIPHNVLAFMPVTLRPRARDYVRFVLGVRRTYPSPALAEAMKRRAQQGWGAPLGEGARGNFSIGESGCVLNTIAGSQDNAQSIPRKDPKE